MVSDVQPIRPRVSEQRPDRVRCEAIASMSVMRRLGVLMATAERPASGNIAAGEARTIRANAIFAIGQQA